MTFDESHRKPQKDKPQKDTHCNRYAEQVNAAISAELWMTFDGLGSNADSWRRPISHSLQPGILRALGSLTREIVVCAPPRRTPGHPTALRRANLPLARMAIQSEASRSTHSLPIPTV
jgi:hypothetical protein